MRPSQSSLRTRNSKSQCQLLHSGKHTFSKIDPWLREHGHSCFHYLFLCTSLRGQLVHYNNGLLKVLLCSNCVISILMFHCTIDLSIHQLISIFFIMGPCIHIFVSSNLKTTTKIVLHNQIQCYTSLHVIDEVPSPT